MSSRLRGSRLSKRLFLLLGFCVLFFAAASAQQQPPRFTFNAGGGLGLNRGAIGSYTSSSYHGVAGGGVNLSRLFSLDAEYMYYNLPFKSVYTKTPQGLPGAKANVQSATLNVIVNVPLHSRWGLYGVGGFGGYRRTASAKQTLLYDGTYCQDVYVFWNVLCTTSGNVVKGNQTVTSRTTTAGGYNLGGGLSYRIGSRLKLYAEARYHRTNNRDIRTQIIPVTLGVRW
jgi:opacity protein-like surface antigen